MLVYIALGHQPGGYRAHSLFWYIEHLRLLPFAKNIVEETGEAVSAECKLLADDVLPVLDVGFGQLISRHEEEVPAAVVFAFYALVPVSDRKFMAF